LHLIKRLQKETSNTLKRRFKLNLFIVKKMRKELLRNQQFHHLPELYVL
jgi:hypothetical protein